MKLPVWQYISTSVNFFSKKAHRSFLNLEMNFAHEVNYFLGQKLNLGQKLDFSEKVNIAPKSGFLVFAKNLIFRCVLFNPENGA